MVAILILSCTFLESTQIVPLQDVLVDVGDELFDPGQVVRGKLFNVIVAGAINIVRWILVLCGLMELLSVVKGHDLVSLAVDDVHWAINVMHPVNVRELVEGESPA